MTGLERARQIVRNHRSSKTKGEVYHSTRNRRNDTPVVYKESKTTKNFHPGGKISNFIEEHKITLHELSEFANISYGHLYMLTRTTGPRNNMGIHVATKLAICTGIPVCDWMEEQSKYNQIVRPGKYKGVIPLPTDKKKYNKKQ